MARHTRAEVSDYAIAIADRAFSAAEIHSRPVYYAIRRAVLAWARDDEDDRGIGNVVVGAVHRWAEWAHPDFRARVEATVAKCVAYCADFEHRTMRELLAPGGDELAALRWAATCPTLDDDDAIALRERGLARIGKSCDGSRLVVGLTRTGASRLAKLTRRHSDASDPHWTE